MQVRNALIPFAVAMMLSHAAAMAQVASPVGSWKSIPITNPNYPIVANVQLTITAVDANQRASGRFNVTFPGASGGGTYTCPNGTVSGTFDGVALKVASTGSNLCSERVWDVKLNGDELTGTYRGADGTTMPMTFTRR